MSKPILYGLEMSPPVRAVLLTANAIGLDFEFKVVDAFSGENKTEEYLKKNPQHTIPTLEDGGKCIWESHAIVTYLASKFGKDDSLYPKDLFTRAVVDQRLHFDNGVLGPRFKKMTELLKENKSDMAEESKQSLLEALGFLETFLGNNSYLVGNSITVADFSCVASVTTIQVIMPIDATKFPKLVKWLKRMAALPYYEKSNGIGIKKVEEYAKLKMADVIAAAGKK